VPSHTLWAGGGPYPRGLDGPQELITRTSSDQGGAPAHVARVATFAARTVTMSCPLDSRCAVDLDVAMDRAVREPQENRTSLSLRISRGFAAFTLWNS